jgi:hypothetical protein
MKKSVATVILAVVASLPALPQNFVPSVTSSTTNPQGEAPRRIVLPIEVFGSNGTAASVPFEISRPLPASGDLQLWLKISGLEFDAQASIKINDSRWLPISTESVMLSKNAAAFGGIGGGFHTFQLKLRLPVDCVVSGANTIVFRFNRTNGITSGYRVLGFNVQSAGVNLLPSEAFANDDPSKWQAPLNDVADISAGRALWTTAVLKESVSGRVIKAHCSDCHAQDGRDLKYFNYSNLSIQTRAMFHGLTAQQGNQIASYIRTLSAPASPYGRPWNPPYQPGPGLDARPVSDWAAGAGIDAVLDNDADTLSYIMPGGTAAKLAHNAYLNQREIPIALQLPDWNHWLPTVHPMDAFGAQFTNSGLVTGYAKIRSELRPNDPTTYKQYHAEIIEWLSHQNNLYAAVRQPATSSAWSDPTYDQQIYSAGQWMMVKSWEINQEYGLEGMSRAVFGPRGADRAWYTDQAFLTSPFMLKIPKDKSPGIGNGLRIALTYDSFAWYQTQLILNDGNGEADGTWPIDRGYALAYLYNDLTWDNVAARPRVGTAGLMLEWLAKIMQTGNDPGDASPFFLILYPSVAGTWSDVSPSQKLELMNTWVRAWVTFVQTLTAEQMFTAPSGVTPQATRKFSALVPGSFTGHLAWAMPRLRYEGVDPKLLDQIANWASNFWPDHDWMADLQQTCRGNVGSEMKCQ